MAKAASPTAARRRRKRFSRTDWLDHGLAELARIGREALKLEAICKSAGLTRGSFYHHFSDHGQFLVALARHWVTVQTEALIARIPPDMAPQARYDAMTDLAIDLDLRLELGIRELSRSHAAVAQVVAEADTRRRAYLTQLYADLYGVPPEDAAFAAEIEYAAYLGTILTQPDITPEEQRALAARFQTMLGRYFNNA